MQELSFIQDLAVIMILAGIVTIVFHLIKQPVVLGYILAGIIIGPYTPPFAFIRNQHTIQMLAELGVIFLMFSLGLEFSLRKLSRVGIAAFLAAVLEIVVMIWIGYTLGQWFHWDFVDSIFLGAMLAISSTTIIVKALRELGLQKKSFVQLIYGILIIEDILAIGIIALLSTLGSNEVFTLKSTFITLGQLLIFLIIAIILGVLIVPRLLNYIFKLKSEETVLISVLALCFGFCLLAIKLKYSIVLGAFLMGAIIAESKYLFKIEKLMEPLRDMFSAIFFVAVGLMFDPKIFVKYTVPVIIITLVVILGKVITCSLTAYLTGRDGRTSLKVGMGLAQIGEFSFIIAALGSSLKITSGFLFPIAVAVSAITTITTPYLIKAADPLANLMARMMPKSLVDVLELYTAWMRGLPSRAQSKEVFHIVKRSLIHIFINLVIVAAIFFGLSFLVKNEVIPMKLILHARLVKTIFWTVALIISLPFIVAIYRKIKALSMLLAAVSVKETVAGRFTSPVRKLIAEIIPIIAMIMLFLFISALSSSILPPAELIILALVIIAILLALLWRKLIKLHSRLQIALMDSVKKDEK